MMNFIGLSGLVGFFLVEVMFHQEPTAFLILHTIVFFYLKWFPWEENRYIPLVAFGGSFGLAVYFSLQRQTFSGIISQTLALVAFDLVHFERNTKTLFYKGFLWVSTLLELALYFEVYQGNTERAMQLFTGAVCAGLLYGAWYLRAKEEPAMIAHPAQ